ncbi:MAG: Flp family type IVb pilin [Pseudomonadota bacterium]
MRRRDACFRFTQACKRFCADESAATAIEYALVAGIMATAAIGFSGMFDALRDNFLQPVNDAVTSI